MLRLVAKASRIYQFITIFKTCDKRNSKKQSQVLKIVINTTVTLYHDDIF